jgi:hypothetical protein
VHFSRTLSQYSATSEYSATIAALQARLPDNNDFATAGTAGIEVVVEADVVIVGSGAGAGVVAGVLCKAGLRVAVVEKGPYVDPQQIPQSDAAAIRASYESSQHLITSDTGAYGCPFRYGA